MPPRIRNKRLFEVEAIRFAQPSYHLLVILLKWFALHDVVGVGCMQGPKAHDIYLIDLHDDDMPFNIMMVESTEVLTEGFEHPALSLQEDGTYINGYVEDDDEEYFGAWYRFAWEDPVVILVPYVEVPGGWALHDLGWSLKQLKAVRSNPPWVGWPYVVCCPGILMQKVGRMIREADETRKSHKRAKKVGIVYTMHPKAEELLRRGKTEDSDSEESEGEGSEGEEVEEDVETEESEEEDQEMLEDQEMFQLTEADEPMDMDSSEEGEDGCMQDLQMNST
jgi:hypothetical protein